MDQVEEVKSKADIVEIVSSYVPLKKSGRNFSGLCPFHGEKTPSFMVSAERQVFKCFGCGEGGDVITFMEKIEGWEFREALEELAKRVGVKLKNTKPTAVTRQKEKLFKINSYAGKFYSYLLLKHKVGERARDYLRKRGIKESTWAKYGLGYSPNSWDQAYAFLRKKGFDDVDIASSGMIIARQGTKRGYYDRFRDRIVFPIRDIKGDTVGFSARVLADSIDQPKYVNSSETAIFHKGSLLFGLDVAKEALRNKGECFLVEGEFDVMSSYQAGIENVVASKGTALTDMQITLVARFCETLVLGLDSDFAGDKAARRGIEMMDSAGLNVKVMGMDGFKDPDEFARSDPGNFKKAYARASNVYDYYLESVAKRFDSNSAFGKKKIGEELLPVFSKITDDMIRAHYTQKLAQILDLDVALVASAIDKRTNIGSTLVEEEKIVAAPKSIEDYFLALLLTLDEIDRSIFKVVDEQDFFEEKSSALVSQIRAIISASKTKKVKKVLEIISKDLKEYVDYLYVTNIGDVSYGPEEGYAELLKIAARIKDTSVRKKLKLITLRIKEAERVGMSDEISKLSVEFDKLSKYLTGAQNAEKSN